jgi:hypothetical protein
LSDEPLVRTLAVDSLTEAGFNVGESVDADEAIKILGTRLGTRSDIQHCASVRLSVERLLSVTNKIFSGNLHWEVLSWAGRA